MALPGASPMASAPGGMPAAESPGAPIGGSPATQATPNRGFEAQALARLAIAVQMLSEIQAMIGASTEAGQAVNKAIGQLGKFIPPGAVSMQAQSNQLDALKMKQQQAGPQIAMLRQAMASGGAPGAA